MLLWEESIPDEMLLSDSLHCTFWFLLLLYLESGRSWAWQGASEGTRTLASSGCRGYTGLGPAEEATDCTPPLFEYVLLKVNVDKKRILAGCYPSAVFPIARLTSVSL